MTHFERLGIDLLNLNRPILDSPLSTNDRSMIQSLLRFAKVAIGQDYFVIPKEQAAFFITRLSKLELLAPLDDFEPISFAQSSITPKIQLLQPDPNQVLLKGFFQKGEGEELFPFAHAHFFAGSRSWVLHEGWLYPVRALPLTLFFKDFPSEGILKLEGEKAANFLQNELSEWRQEGALIFEEEKTLTEILTSKPYIHYTVEEQFGEERLRMELYFTYDGRKVPPNQGPQDLLVEWKEGENPLLLRRDLEFEQAILEKLYKIGFKRVGSFLFEIEGDLALDFLSSRIEEEIGLPANSPQFSQLKVLGQLGKKELKAKTVEEGTDWFSLQVGFEFEDKKIPYDVIHALLAQGRRYLSIPGRGFVKLNTEELFDFEQALKELEIEKDSFEKFRLSQFHAPYLEGLVQMEVEGNEHFRSILQFFKHQDQIPPVELPEHLRPVLRGYQKQGYDWLNFLHAHHFHGILADDMGLGKTLQMLAYLQQERDRLALNPEKRKPSLVIAPTSVIFNWKQEAEKFTPSLKTLLYQDENRKQFLESLSEYDFVIMSYTIFRRDSEWLVEKEWQTVVLDEAQNIKNHRSKTAQLAYRLKAKQRFALTGTPLENKLSELWSIFHFLMPSFLGSFSHFQRTYQQPVEQQQEEPLRRLRRRIYPFILRRIKGDVATELPPKTEIIHYSEMLPEQRKLYQQVLFACRKEVFETIEREGIENSQISIFTALLRLRQICCHPKLVGKRFDRKTMASGKFESFQELILEVLSEGHRVLVFSQFVEMLGILRQWLEEKQIVHEYLDGRTRNRQEKIKHFQTNSQVAVFLISLRAGGTGLNLTEADYVIHYDPWWNPAVQEQATDRAHRLGQTQHVFSYKLITKESVEEKILGLQERKKNLFRGVLSTDSAFGKKLKMEDLEFLFS